LSKPIPADTFGVVRAPILAALAIAGVASCRKEASRSVELRVAAAADLARALPEIAVAFEKATGVKVTVTFGSSGLLAKQVQEGAPFDVFFAANAAFVEEAVKSGACKAETLAPYAEGRIVLWSKKDAPIAPAASIADLGDERFTKIAIAHPEHAPYGRAAVEALQKAGVYDKVKPKLVFGENVQQALQYAQSGNVEAAIVALSLVMFTEGGTWIPIDPALHGPLRQSLAICGDRKDKAEASAAFTAFVTASNGRAIMRKHGFVLPGENIATAP
jgi:molybdate transport system substrate-binding protein